MPISIFAMTTLIIGFTGLVWSANIFVSGSASLAKHLGMTPTLIGLTVVAFGTSAPEMFVSAEAALDGVPNLAIGNAIGSNIANIGLVLGVTAIIAAIPINTRLMRLEIPLLLVATFLAIFFLWDLYLSVLEGVGLLTAAILATLALIWDARGAKSISSSELAERAIPPELNYLKAIIYVALGLLALLGFADLLVWSAKSIAEHFGVSPMIIGLTIVALGTSLPELAASIASALKGHHDIAIGNIIGSNLLNILAVMAIPGILSPSSLTAMTVNRDLFVMVLLTFALVAIVGLASLRQKSVTPSLGRPIGLLLLLSYGFYYTFIF
ncbi:MAG: calcium/sodium antiporter [Pseudomonadota bacterium]|nr:calcium/sodium antiporter [Pseudomonadota bacterium]